MTCVDTANILHDSVVCSSCGGEGWGRSRAAAELRGSAVMCCGDVLRCCSYLSRRCVNSALPLLRLHGSMQSGQDVAVNMSVLHLCNAVCPLET